MKSLFARFLEITLVLLALLAAPLRAQQPGAPEQATAAALDLFNRGQVADAIAAYEKVLKDYPTSLVVAEAQFRLGYLYFQQGNFEKSNEMLGKVMGPPAPPEIQEMAAGLRPQVTAAKASKLEEGQPGRAAGFEEAIKQFDEFIAKFPNSADVETAVYGKALAQFQIKKYDDSIASLKQNLAKFPRSESILDSEYLLGIALAAAGKDQEAEKCMSDIIAKNSDVALANDAQFQVGEIYFNRAVAAEASEQAGLYQKAIAAYQAVKGKELVQKAQEARLAGFVQRIREAGIRRDLAGVKAAQRLKLLESQKIAAMKDRPETLTSAKVKIALSHFQLQKYQDALSLLLKVQPEAKDEALKKQIQYYITLCYTSLNQTDKAVEAYNEFQSQYRGDALAENLPLAVGSMFFNLKAEGQTGPSKDNLDQAEKYLAESQQIYPTGKFTPQAILLQANVYLQTKRLPEAEKSYAAFLATNPKKELAAGAELGLAGILKDSGQLDAALARYKTIREQYAGMPEAEQAFFWTGQIPLLKQDYKTANAEITAFLAKFPESALKPSALFAQAQSENALGGKAKAQEIFKEIVDQYPKSDAAPYACFQLAAIYASDQKVEEMVGIMKTFIEKFPTHDKIFYAYDTIGQSQINTSKTQEAIATYSEMASKYPRDPQAPEALLKVCNLWLHAARSMGSYSALTPEQRTEWGKALNNSLEAGAQLLEQYPESKSVAIALQTLLEDQKLLAAAKVKTPADIETYFQDLAAKFSSNPTLKSKVLFKLAAYLFEKDKNLALQQMTAAYDPKLLYAPADIDLYGGALLESGKLDEASQVFAKLAVDYAIPQGLTPDKASPQVQEAQAIALYGLGKSLQKQDKVTEAAAKFDELKRLYPWSPKILEANFGIAKSLAQQKKFDEATTLLVQIIRAQTATADLRANAMLLGGDIQNEKKQFEAAIDYYIKIATFYEGVPAAASEGLWKGGQLLEQQASALSETTKPTRSAQLAKAMKAYKELTEKYPNSPFVAQAQARLQQLAPK